MKKLLIVESPAKIKTLSKILGKDFKIMSTLGHIMDLPRKSIGVEITKSDIKLEYVPIEDKEKIIADIVKAAKTADEIYLAPDPDREGEIIAWHVEQEIKKATKGSKKKIHRIGFNEITKSAVEEAINNPEKVDLHRVAAQQARRVLDRWVGYEVSPILWQKIKAGLSAGRVQSVALKIICEREQAIRDFKPEEYWTIEGLFKQAKASLSAMLTHISKKKADIKNEKAANKILDDLKKTEFAVESIVDKQRSKNPLPPFMTSTLQQAAHNQLGFSVKRTMQVAQKLYEGIPLKDPDHPVALITYMRTDSLRLSETALKQARSYIGSQFEKAYLPQKANVFSKKSKSKTQDAHEAIRPIDVALTPTILRQYLGADEIKLYELIWKRCVASQMTPAQYAQRQVTIQGGKYTFKTTGSTLIFDGFLKVYKDDEDKDETTIIPKELEEKQPIELTKTDPKQHFTQPPPRFNESSLVKELEKEGIGRPSTYASIISTIQARDYTELDDRKRFVPTELGMTVSKLLSDNLPKIMKISFTAQMEQELDKIEHEKLDRDKLLRTFYQEFEEDLEEFRGKRKRTAEKTDITCPKCKEGKLLIRFGRAGSFLGCSTYPTCDFTTNFKRDEDGKIEIVETIHPTVLKEKCPECGEPLRRIVGKCGEFISCSGYPKCKYVHQQYASFKCPQDKGDVAKRCWKGGTFWGCVNYPDCKFAIFSDIEEKPCPQCKKPYLMKKTNKEGNTILHCTKECGYSHPQKAKK
ncbi:type I DNA topoisomerase [Candidatus Babeliales bacterium]|nr:type I DNA topoisomerase [Candidatus Babeliales bacterium]